MPPQVPRALAKGRSTNSGLGVARAAKTTVKIPAFPAPWMAALAQVNFQLAAGNIVSRDHGDRVTRLHGSGHASKVATVRWWWILRAEGHPLNFVEAECLDRRGLWKQAIATATTALYPRAAGAAYAPLALQLASTCVGAGQWGVAADLLRYAATQRHLATSEGCHMPLDGRPGSSSTPPQHPARQAINLVGRMPQWDAALDVARSALRIIAPQDRPQLAAFLLARAASWKPGAWAPALRIVSRAFRHRTVPPPVAFVAMQLSATCMEDAKLVLRYGRIALEPAPGVATAPVGAELEARILNVLAKGHVPPKDITAFGNMIAAHRQRASPAPRAPTR